MPASDYRTLDLPDAPGFFWDTLHALWVPGDPYQPEDGTPRYYETKARIAAWVKPQRVVEIGVRAGYSALAFHMGHPFRTFFGIDLDEGTMGGVKGYFDHANDRLALLPGLRVILHTADSQLLKELPHNARHADLFHVDGDHTPHGCAHDIMLAITSGASWILVDDYDYTEHVRDGTDFIVRKLGLAAWYVSDGGYRGNLLIRGRPS